MCHTADSMSPRDRLASKIRTRTNDGDDILDYLYEVFYDNEPEVLHGHRLQSARLLVIYGQLSQEALERLKKLSHCSDRKAERAEASSDARIAKTIRKMTDDAEGIVAYLLNTMNGIDPSRKKPVCHNSRLAAARELLRRGYPCECETAASAAPAPTAASESVRPAAAGPEPTTETHEPATDDTEDAEEEANTQKILAKIQKIIDETDPSEFEEENDSGHKPDYSMWDYIETLPKPEITPEHARIGAALFHEAVERQRRWHESGVKIPTRKDHYNYDDG